MISQQEIDWDSLAHVLCGLILLGRLGDIISTWLITPKLDLEANPIVRWLGWRFAVATVLLCLVPYVVDLWIAVILVPPFLMISGSNVGKIWMVRALGEKQVLEHSIHTVFKMGDQTVDVRGSVKFLRAPGSPWTSYRMETGPGRDVEATFTDGRVSVTTETETTEIEAPPDARPTYGYYPIVTTIAFEEGEEFPFTPINDGDGALMEPRTYVVTGPDEVDINGETLSLWKIEEREGATPKNIYWLDEKRSIRKSYWDGAESYLTETKEAALTNLDEDLQRLA